MADFSRLQFGAPSAERDVLTGLEDYFIESGAFSRIASGEKSIVLGSRGAGKSAIFKTLSARRKAAGDLVIELSPEDYSYELLGQTMAREQEGAWLKSGAYAAAWKYLLLTLAMKQVQTKLGRPSGREEKAMYRFLRDNFPNSGRNPWDSFISYLKRLEGVKLGSLEATLKTRELHKLYKLEEIEPFMPALISASRRCSISIMIDELDRGWDASEDAQAFASGLFQASTAINRLAPGFHVFMSLRQELYENIPAIYDDAQKYRDLFETIAWSGQELYKLLASRIRHFVPDLQDASDDFCWSAVFEEPNRSFRFMLDRSFHRPRELITYASMALDRLRERGGQAPITHRAITEVELAYSDGRVHDLASEFKYQYPGVLSIIETFRQAPSEFSREALEERCLMIAVEETKVASDARPWAVGADPDDIVEALWRIGFLRARYQRGARSYTGQERWVRGSFQDPNVSLHTVDQFDVHEAFRAYLGSRTPLGRVADGLASERDLSGVRLRP